MDKISMAVAGINKSTPHVGTFTCNNGHILNDDQFLNRTPFTHFLPILSVSHLTSPLSFWTQQLSIRTPLKNSMSNLYLPRNTICITERLENLPTIVSMGVNTEQFYYHAPVLIMQSPQQETDRQTDPPMCQIYCTLNTRHHSDSIL